MQRTMAQEESSREFLLERGSRFTHCPTFLKQLNQKQNLAAVSQGKGSPFSEEPAFWIWDEFLRATSPFLGLVLLCRAPWQDGCRVHILEQQTKPVWPVFPDSLPHTEPPLSL